VILQKPTAASRCPERVNPAERRRYLLAGLGLALVLLALLWLPGDGPSADPITDLLKSITPVTIPREPLVALQVGHLNAHEHPDELAPLRASTGGLANGVAEVDVNRRVAVHAAAALEELGVEVQILPATVPPDYRASAFISIHADSNCRNAAHPSPPALPPAAERLRQSPPTPRHDQRIRPTTQLRHPTSSTHTTIAQPRPFLHTPQLSTHSSPNDRRPFPAPCRHIF